VAPVIFPFSMTGTPLTSTNSHTLRQLVGLVEGSEVPDGFGIEDHYISPHSLLQDSAIAEVHTLGGKSSEFADRIFEG